MAVIMQVFTAAQQKATHSELTHASLDRARDLAELLSRETEPEALLARLGYAQTDDCFIYRDENGCELRVTLANAVHESGTLYTANIAAYTGEKQLFSLPSAYYAAKEADAP